MARYPQQRERIFLVGGRTEHDDLVLVDARSGEPYVANPSPSRRAKKEYIELPMGQFEDLRVRVGLVRSGAKGKYPNVRITSSQAVFALMSPFQNEAQEVFSVILLDAGNQVLGIHEVHRGGLHSAAVEPGMVFKAALLANAAAVILVHNHPSGRVTHSEDDVVLSRALDEAGRILGIKVLDFVIIGYEAFESFADRRLL